MKNPSKTQTNVARVYIANSQDIYSIRHTPTETIYEDRHGSIRVAGTHHSREQMERAMFHPTNPTPFQQFERT